MPRTRSASARAAGDREELQQQKPRLPRQQEPEKKQQAQKLVTAPTPSDELVSLKRGGTTARCRRSHRAQFVLVEVASLKRLWVDRTPAHIRFPSPATRLALKQNT